MFDIIDETSMTRDLLIAMGLEIDPTTNSIIDQETKNQLQFNGLIIKANTDPTKGLYISEYDIKFNPLDPECTKIMEKLFEKFINDEEEMGNISHVPSYYFDKISPEKEGDLYKFSLVMIYEDGSKISGEAYYNKIICLERAIFKINGTFADKDLTPFDIPPIDNNEEEEAKPIDIQEILKRQEQNDIK